MRIVENLVGNAIKAVAESVPKEWKANHPDKLETYGVIRVNYRFDQNYHVLEISDSGPGMSPQTVREILEGSARTSWANSAGSGLGTKVVLDLAATHDARLQIDSRLGEGTTFRPHVAIDVPGAVGAASPQKSS
jgi:signal transduction histidine kinase